MVHLILFMNKNLNLPPPPPPLPPTPLTPSSLTPPPPPPSSLSAPSASYYWSRWVPSLEIWTVVLLLLKSYLTNLYSHNSLSISPSCSPTLPPNPPSVHNLHAITKMVLGHQTITSLTPSLYIVLYSVQFI